MNFIASLVNNNNKNIQVEQMKRKYVKTEVTKQKCKVTSWTEEFEKFREILHESQTCR